MAGEVWEVTVKDPILLKALREIGRRLTFGKPVNGTKSTNFDARFVFVAFTTPNTSHTIVHGLGRTPVGMIQVSSLANGQVLGTRLESTGISTDKYIYLKSEQAVTVPLFIW